MFRFSLRWALALLLIGCSARWRHFEGQTRMEELRLERGERLEIRADDCSLTLRGDFRELRLHGKENYVQVLGRVENVRMDGEANKLECAQAPARVSLHGKGQRVLISERPGASRPQVDVQGKDQAVQFRPASQVPAEN